MINSLDTALVLAGRGWHVFPCKPDKTPYTSHGFKDATSDPAEIRKLWAKYPGELIGIACERSGFFALDIDRKNGVDGLRSWVDLVTTCGNSQNVPTGPMQLTPSGGIHALFKMPAGVKIPNNAGKLGPGLDLRSAGYICSGGAYQWQPEHGPETLMTEAPAWLVEIIREMSKPRAAAPAQTAARQDAGAYWYSHYLPLAKEGNRNTMLYSMCQQLSWSGVGEGEAENLALSFAADKGLSEKEALATMRSAYAAPKREPAKLPFLEGIQAERPAENSPAPAHQAPENPPEQNQQPTVKTFADMAGMIGPIAWAWQGWLPKGMLTILAGTSGAGKSCLALRIAGCYLRGDPWPDGTPYEDDRGAVLWCEAEAAQAVNLERARTWGFPLDQLYTPLPNPLDDLKLDIEGHRAMLAQKAAMPEVKLIVIDSLRGILGRGDENASDTLSFIKWIAELARDTGKPIILTHHLRKRSVIDIEGEGVELERLRGSSAIVQTARLVWALDCPIIGNQDEKRLSVIKSNLAKFPHAVGVRIGENGVSFGDAPEMPKQETIADKAIDLLLSLLAKEPRPATEIEEQFNGAGISRSSMNRAKEKLGIVPARVGGRWLWSLPARNDGLTDD